MLRYRMISALAAAAMCLTVVGGAQAATPFQDDVNAAIDAGLAYARANNHFTVNTQGNGLSLLALLQKESVPAGYAGLVVPGDKILAENAACILIDSATFGDRAGFYSYYDGQVLMGLSVYLRTGGPDQPAAAAGHNCTGRSARATIDKVVDRALAAQTPGDPATGSCAGFWDYYDPGCDSSTTQLTSAGLAAAKAFYRAKGESADKSRIPVIDSALTRVSDGYAANGKASAECVWDSCGTGGCAGHGYQVLYYGPSSQQTASGTFVQLMASGKSVNDPAVQRYLRWLQNAYNYTANTVNQGWSPAYFYFLWSSAKAFDIIDSSGVAPTGTNIGTAAMGTLPPLSACGYSRLANRDPAVDTRPAVRGAGGAGYYTATSKGWYYDYAYRLMSLQAGTGQFPNPNGSWNTQVDHAYAMLILERSVGGACVDSDGDGICDEDEQADALYCDADFDGKVTYSDVAAVGALITGKYPMGIPLTPANEWANYANSGSSASRIDANDYWQCAFVRAGSRPLNYYGTSPE
jgi:hypothetical protein